VDILKGDGELNENVIFNRKRNLFYARKQEAGGFLENEK
jgi:hypothetical protein